MAEASWPSPNHGTPARSVTDTEYVRLAPWNSDGVFANSSDVVYANSSGMQVHVRADKYALVRGHAWSSGTTEYNLTIAANSSGSTRTDTVVLRLDRSTWDVTAAVRQGTPGAGAPALQRDTGDTGLWEIPLADVTVMNGASSIAAGNVKGRVLLQSAGARACNAIADIQSLLIAGDIIYEVSTGRWIGWTGAGGVILYEDTGWTSLTSAGSYWTPVIDNLGRKLARMVTLRVALQRAIATFTKSDPNGSLLINLPTALRPAREQHSAVFFSGGIGGARVDVTPDGKVTLNHNTVDVAVGRTCLFTMTYPVD